MLQLPPIIVIDWPILLLQHDTLLLEHLQSLLWYYHLVILEGGHGFLALRGNARLLLKRRRTANTTVRFRCISSFCPALGLRCHDSFPNE